jgi:hypothetical protein
MTENGKKEPSRGDCKHRRRRSWKSSSSPYTHTHRENGCCQRVFLFFKRPEKSLSSLLPCRERKRETIYSVKSR